MESAFVRRMRWDGGRAVLMVVVFVVTTVLATDPPAGWEESLFRAIVDLPYAFQLLLFPLQQAGTLVAVPIAAAILWRLARDWRPPAGLMIGGVGLGWGLAKLIKELVARGRPSDVLDDVLLGFGAPSSGLGFPSGHAVVVFVIAVSLSPYLRRPWRWAVYGLAVTTCLGRVITTAHLPLDVLGGAAYGALIGSLVNLVVGIRADQVQAPLRQP